MPTPTYTVIQNVTLSSRATAVTFNSIPQNFKHIVLMTNFQMPGEFAGANIRATLGGVHSYNFLGIKSNNAIDIDNVSRLRIFNAAPANVRLNAIIDFFEYTSSNILKSGIIRAYNQNTNLTQSAWNNNLSTAITTITVDTGGTSSEFESGSRFTLFGIVG